MATVSAPPLYPPPSPPRGWLQRHWILALFLAFSVLVVLAGLFVGGLLTIIEASFKRSDTYTQAVSKAHANAQVVEKFGQPIQQGWLVSGNINVSGSSGHADLAIPISGPKSKGTIYVVATRSDGRWRFDTLEVEVSGQEQRIDLLASPPAAP